MLSVCGAGGSGKRVIVGVGEYGVNRWRSKILNDDSGRNKILKPMDLEHR